MAFLKLRYKNTIELICIQSRKKLKLNVVSFG